MFIRIDLKHGFLSCQTITRYQCLIGHDPTNADLGRVWGGGGSMGVM